MIDKSVASVDAAVADIPDGSTIMVGGFGPAGQPYALLDALIRRCPRELTLISNNAGNGDFGLAALLKAGCVRKVICSFPRQSDSWVFDDLYRRGELELELIPQGNLAARIQAAGSGLGGFYTPTGYGTELAQGKETREIDGRHYVFELPLRADFALIIAGATCGITKPGATLGRSWPWPPPAPLLKLIAWCRWANWILKTSLRQGSSYSAW